MEVLGDFVVGGGEFFNPGESAAGDPWWDAVAAWGYAFAGAAEERPYEVAVVDLGEDISAVEWFFGEIAEGAVKICESREL